MKTEVHTFKLQAECQFCGRTYLDGHQRIPLPPYGLAGTPDDWIPMVRQVQVQSVAMVCPTCMLEITATVKEVISDGEFINIVTATKREADREGNESE